ncbi:MAG: hypothetical protein L0332_34925 [Chloroflexi bacterium]|nr:hypothetical protein [Chloroflexota bacterium]MCI0575608.1 hypothetical protein [Chloroflexota bacterium]MCI0645055.1 hypothetical protein [Chloroflexota bacterium]MCI0731891.1 hypothetical protein [Chloroflexota bacterium]
MRPTILFLCPHGAAKSILAAAYCRQLAAHNGLDWHITSAGTEPDDAPSPAVVELLRAEGVDVSGYAPRLVTGDELATADWVVSLGCDVGQLVVPGPEKIIDWSDIPPPGQDLAGASALIRERVADLVERLPKEVVPG